MKLMDGNENYTFSGYAPGAPAAPPPPPEVKVRTMRSDLEAMTKSGGGLPQFHGVAVGTLSFQRKVATGGITGESVATSKTSGEGSRAAILVLVAIAAVAGIALVGYFVYAIFFANGTAQQPATTAQPVPTSSTPSANPTANPVATGPFTHASLFRKPADQVLTLTLLSGSAASSAADLQTFNQKLTALLTSADKNATFIEINVKDSAGNGVAISDILAEEDAQVLDPQFLAAHFNQDATFFVYREKGGFWPGFVLSLKRGENWLFLGSDVQKLESSPAIANFYLQDVGTPAASGFTDATASSTAVRILSFPSAGPSTSFVYGWYQARLVLSTSENGFIQAIDRL